MRYCAKDQEVDQLLQHDKNLISKIKKSYPEVAFHFSNNNQSMENNKKLKEGQQERLQVLSRYSDRAEIIFNNSMGNYKEKMFPQMTS